MQIYADDNFSCSPSFGRGTDRDYAWRRVYQLAWPAAIRVFISCRRCPAIAGPAPRRLQLVQEIAKTATGCARLTPAGLPL